MSEIPHPRAVVDRFSVVAWNILLDQTRVDKGLVSPQADRIDSQIATLQNLRDSGINLDVVGICEAELTAEGQHNGEYMAEALTDERGYWAFHNETRRTHQREYIGMFGTRVNNREVLELPSDKKAVITRTGKVAIAMNHFRNQYVGKDREFQARALLEYFDNQPYGVIMGDFNALAAEKSRRIIYKAGFTSVFELLGRMEQPPTFPTEEYWDAFVKKPVHKRFLHGAVSLDDIYVKGLIVNDADRFKGDSDHWGLWADLSVPVTPVKRKYAQRLKHGWHTSKASLAPILK